MIDTAGTLVNAASALMERAGAKEVYACATHGLFNAPAMERIQQSPIKELVVLDTVPVPQEKRIGKLTVLPVAPIFAEAIERVFEDKPVSPLFG
jgi:ribose-phosphate pyrophosphokinase